MYFDISAGGVRVLGAHIEGGGDAFIRFDNDPPIGLPTYVRDLRIAPSGLLCAFKGQNDRAYIVTRAGWVMEQGAVAGDEAVALSPSGHLAYVIDPGPRKPPVEYMFNGAPRPIPARHHGTTQGIFAVTDDGAVTWGDDRLVPLAIGPFSLIKWTQRGEWTWGVTQWGIAAWHAGRQRGYIVRRDPSPLRTPRGVVLEGHLVIALSIPAIEIHEREFEPFVEPVPAPPPPPGPKPTPKPDPIQEPSTMKLPADVHATYAAVLAKFPHSGDDTNRRLMHRRAVATVRKRHGLQWVTKTEHNTGWDAQSTDALAFVPGPLPVTTTVRVPMYVWDMINGTTRDLAVHPGEESEPLTPRYVLAPEAEDWLAGDEPKPDPIEDPGDDPKPPPGPVPTGDLAAAMAQLAVITKALNLTMSVTLTPKEQ